MKTLRKTTAAAAALALVITVLATTSAATAQDGDGGDGNGSDICSDLNDQQRRYFQSIGACQGQQRIYPDGLTISATGGAAAVTHAGRNVEYARSTSPNVDCPSSGELVLEVRTDGRTKIENGKVVVITHGKLLYSFSAECSEQTACPSGTFLMLLPQNNDPLHWPWVCDSPSNLVNCPAGQGLNCSDSPTWRDNPNTPEREDLTFNGCGTTYTLPPFPENLSNLGFSEGNPPPIGNQHHQEYLDWLGDKTITGHVC